MAPAGVLGVTGWSLWSSSSPEVCFVSILIFLILTITVVTICIKCRRKQDVQIEVINQGQTLPKTEAFPANKSFSNDDQPQGTQLPDLPSWRHHKNMPENKLPQALPRNQASP
ncbi:uncharacterized protein LOC105018035 [Esox lucius]|uniref:uncharacterized protein LOC105018035 n=1 Tax=Esox lucius TaxID=8010 RepID=UPI00097335FF|nr:uncharacterized protein LOC105018035 [Esox lucius]XP_019911955.1 uncharacterized protein LOC105018035 [Esox lucius]